MSCVGIYMETKDQRAVFNHELALQQGMSLIEKTDFGGCPEFVRARVELGLRQCHPFVTVTYWDFEAEMEAEGPNEEGNYSLLIKQETPIYSASCH